MTIAPLGSPPDRDAPLNRRLIGSFAALALLVCAALPQAVAAPPRPREQPLYQHTGTASWYGRYHQGRRMADGRRFNMNKLTAAHRSLPLATTARVTNLENGRVVIVEITDRGPYGRGRIIDLSSRAAQLLGMHEEGVAKVKIEVLASDQHVKVASND